MDSVSESDRMNTDSKEISNHGEGRQSRKRSKSKERERKRRKSRSASSNASSRSSSASRSRSKHSKKKKKRRKEEKVKDSSRERSRSRSSSKKSKKSKKDKKKKKLKKLKKRELKELKRLVKLRNKEFKQKNGKAENGDKEKEDEAEAALIGPTVALQKKSPAKNANKGRDLKPMTKEEWEAKQSVVRRVYDPETGRHRLVKGDGEVLEECVSRQRHMEINRLATASDGDYFQKVISSQLS